MTSIPRLLVTVLGLLAGCQTSQDRPNPSTQTGTEARPGKRVDVTAILGGANRAVIADMDGDGDGELVVIDAARIRVLDPSGRELAMATVSAGIQVVAAADLDGDRRAELYAGWGTSREHMRATAHVTAHRLQGTTLVEETVLVPETSRAEITAIVPEPQSKALLVAHFESKYLVTSRLLRRDAQGWTGEVLATLRAATSYAIGDVTADGTPDIIVGRVYGDAIGVDGDAFVLARDGTRTPIPSTRGLRSLALADSDADGKLEIFMGDGWHQNYGKQAQGLLSTARHARTGFATEVVENTAGQFEIARIVPARIDGRTVLVTLGSHYVRMFARTGQRWRGVTIGGRARDIAVGDLDGVAGDEVLIVGDTSELVDLRGVLHD